MGKTDQFSNFFGYFRVFQVVEHTAVLEGIQKKMRFFQKIEKIDFWLISDKWDVQLSGFG
jgi:hypothetical protein